MMDEQKNFWKITDQLVQFMKDDEDLDGACEHCPFCDKCDTEELYWGCMCWELSMGEDL